MIDCGDVKGFEDRILDGVLIGVGSLGLWFSDGAQVVVSCPLLLKEGEGVKIGHGEDPYSSSILFRCLNERVVRASICDHGILRLEFDRGASIEIIPERSGLESYVVIIGGEVIPVLLN
jgi:hypothetical protein